MDHDSRSSPPPPDRGLFDFLSEPTGPGAEHFRRVLLVGLLAGPSTADALRERARIPGTNKIGIIVSGLRKRGLIVRTGYAQATAAAARGRLTRVWELTEAGRREALRLANAGGTAQEPAA